MKLMRAALAALAFLVCAPGAAQAAYPGRNGRIVFDRGSNIYSISPAGSGLRKLTSGRDFEGGAVWSPDGGHLIYSKGGSTYANELWIMRADGTGERELVDPRGGYSGGSWRPDGKRIVFSTHSRRNEGDLWTIRPDGTGLRRLTRTDRPEISPEWSPDGDRIAFFSYRLRGWDIWTMDATGGDVRRVTRDATYSKRCGGYGGFHGLDYSPDGGRLLFSANKGECAVDLWIVGEDGTRLRKVMDGTFGLLSAGWSPNGRKIVFSDSAGDGYASLFKMRIDGSHRKRITDAAEVFDTAPDWAPRAG